MSSGRNPKKARKQQESECQLLVFLYIYSILGFYGSNKKVSHVFHFRKGTMMNYNSFVKVAVKYLRANLMQVIG